MNDVKPKDLWEVLQRSHVVSGSMPEENVVSTPWYLRIMLGVLGWIASVFLFGFVVLLLEFDTDNNVAHMVIGAIALVVAYFIFIKQSTAFSEQFGLATSFAGQGLVLYGFIEFSELDVNEVWWSVAVLQIVVASFLSNTIQRFVSSFIGVNAIYFALSVDGIQSIMSGVISVLVVLMWLNEYRWPPLSRFLRPVAYGLTVALLQWNAHYFFVATFDDLLYLQGDIQSVIPQLIINFIVGALLLIVVAHIMRANDVRWRSRSMLIAMGVSLLIVSVSFEMAGVVSAFTVILLAYMNGNRLLLGLGITTLLLFISGFYYTLASTLLFKSAILAATGVVLLLGRWVLLTWVFTRKDSSHA